MFAKICFIFLLFLIYSCIGWILEVGGKLIEKQRFINRGFLIGPYCPIYGWGCLAILLLLNKYKSDPLTLFFMSMVICSILEYITSYIMEKLFKTRWWDYSNKRFNLNGRICLDTMIPFGILGCLVILVINPFFTNLLLKIPSNILNVIAIILFILFLIDNIISFKVIYGFKDTVKSVEKDATEEITKKVREILANRGYLYRRLVKAFPNIKNRQEYLMEVKKKLDNDLKKIKPKMVTKGKLERSEEDGKTK